MTDLLLHTTPPTGLSVSTLIAVDPGSAGWEFCGLTVLRLTPGTSWRGKTGPDEVALVPLCGSCIVRSGEHEWGIGGRENVFAGPTSSVYLPISTEYQVRADDTLELAICGARAQRSYPPRFISADEVAVEIRGAGNAARQINHIIKPDFPADRLAGRRGDHPERQLVQLPAPQARRQPDAARRPISRRSTTTGSIRRTVSPSNGSTPQMAGSTRRGPSATAICCWCPRAITPSPSPTATPGTT